MINDRIKNSEKKEGFTLIELSLSIAFISVLSLAVALIITNSISAYHRGLVLNQINTTGMELVDDMRAAVQNAPVGSLKVLCETMLDGDAEAACKKEGGQRLVAARKMGKVQEINEDVPLLGVFCTGNYSYIWNSGYRFSEDFEVTSAENAATFKYRDLEGKEVTYPNTINPNTIRMLKIKDGKRAVCAAFSETSDSNVINIYDEKYGKVEEDPIELLSENSNLALYDLYAPVPAMSGGMNNAYYSVSFVLGTLQGGANVVAQGNYCATPEGMENSAIENFDYCAINKFNFAAQAIGGGE